MTNETLTTANENINENIQQIAPDDSEMLLHENLKALRNQHKLTQAKVAEVLGVQITTISNWEVGYSHPHVNMLVPICQLYNTSPNELLGYTNELVRGTEV